MAGFSVSSTVPSGSSRLRLRFCELPEGTGSGAMRVFSVETDEGGDCESWGKATELTLLSFRALGKDPPQDHNQHEVYRALEIISHSVHCALCSSQFVRL